MHGRRHSSAELANLLLSDDEVEQSPPQPQRRIVVPHHSASSAELAGLLLERGESSVDGMMGIVQASDMSAELLGESRPSQNPSPGKTTHNWQTDFGPAVGVAGMVTNIRMSPQCYFRVEKIMATDTFSPNGMGTQIISAMVGNKIQRATAVGGTMSLFFAQNALGNGVEWDVGEPALDIVLTVRFLEACTFYCSAFGTEWR